MEDNGLEIEDIDFSIIGPNKEKVNEIDFSVQSLLTLSDHRQSPKQEQTENIEVNQSKKQQLPQQGSFMRDLGKIQKSLSYQSAVFNIYQTSQIHAEITRTIEGKQESICTKTFNNINNLTSATKAECKVFQPECKHLIIDFNQVSVENSDFKLKQNFQNYFGWEEACKRKNQDVTKSTSRSDAKNKKKSVSQLQIVPTLEGSKSKDSLHSFSSNSKFQSKIHINVRPSEDKPLKLKQKKIKPKASLSKETPKFKIIKNNERFKTMTGRLDSKSTSRSNSSAAAKGFHKKKTNKKEKIKKQKNEIQADIYSQYFGFASQTNHEAQNTKSQQFVSPSPKSKGKTIVFSKKNVYSKVIGHK